LALGRAERRWFLESEPVYRGNVVQFLSEGAEYFEQWFFGLDRLRSSRHETRRLLHHAWRLADVARFGRLSGSARVSEHIGAAASNGVDIRLSISGHGLGAIALALPMATRLIRIPTLQILLDLTSASVSGSNHQKLSVFQDGDEIWALIGSVDLAPTRFERSHRRLGPRRYQSHRGPSHDVGLRIHGPAATELAIRLAARWSMLCAVPGRRRIRQLSACTPLRILSENAAIDPWGSAIQVAETVPHGSDLPIPPSNSLGALYRKAIKAARSFVYIEDQYFTPDFRDSPRAARMTKEDDNLLPLLLDALSRGVHLIIVVPTPNRGSAGLVDRLIRSRRDAAVRKLLQHPRADRLVVCHYDPSVHPVYIHSKLLLCDDTFMLVSSANVNRRSFFTDFEIGVGVFDPLVVRAIRRRLWTEHIGTALGSAYSSHPADVDAWARILRSSQRLTGYRALTKDSRMLARLMTWANDRLVDPLPSGWRDVASRTLEG
jgi:phosphatidylserine/phosphatidylglycerophosphate/cardiolipin synthase-like enzyme